MKSLLLVGTCAILLLVASCKEPIDCCGPLDARENTVIIDTGSLKIQPAIVYEDANSFTIRSGATKDSSTIAEITMSFRSRPVADGSYTAVAQVGSANEISISGFSGANKALNFHTISNGAQARVSIEHGRLHIIGTGLAIRRTDSSLAQGFVSINMTTP